MKITTLLASLLIAMTFSACEEKSNASQEDSTTQTEVAPTPKAVEPEPTEPIPAPATVPAPKPVEKKPEPAPVSTPTPTPTPTPKPEPVTKAPAPTSNFDAQAVFASKCQSCHGNVGQNKALGKSKIINTFTANQAETALLGYKKGTYGGAMKGLMKTQLTAFSETELKALAIYISKLQ